MKLMDIAFEFIVTNERIDNNKIELIDFITY